MVEAADEILAGYVPFLYDLTVDGLRGIPLSDLRAVSPSCASRLARFGLRSVHDLLSHTPLHYLDRSDATTIAELEDGQVGTFVARVDTAQTTTVAGRRASKVRVHDATGHVDATFFNMPWKSQVLASGDEVVVRGRLRTWTSDHGSHHLQMTNPLMDRTGSTTAPVVAIYPQSPKLQVTTWEVHRAAMEAVNRLGDLVDPIPADLVRGGPHLMGRLEAYASIHHPDSIGQATAARDRLAYDELLHLQLAHGLRRLGLRRPAGVSHVLSGDLTSQLIGNRGIPPSTSQRMAMTMVADDLRSPGLLHRLVQGDIGSGAELVIAAAILMAVEGQHQVHVIVPDTQVGRQVAHLNTLLTQVTKDGRPIRIAGVIDGPNSGVDDADVLVCGPDHAQSSDTPGLRVVTDIQALSSAPTLYDGADLLVVPAAPLPHTTAMITLGHLAVTTLERAAPPAAHVQTVWVDASPDTSDTSDPVWMQIRTQAARGRQSYLVCPTGTADRVHADLSAGALSDVRVGVTGTDEAAFIDGAVDVLVADSNTLPIDGLPNVAAVIIVDPAGYKITELHELRRRLNSSSHRHCVCILAGTAASADAKRRLEAVVASTDGFKLANLDDSLDLRVATLPADLPLLAMARADATVLLEQDPALARWPQLRTEVSAAVD